MFLVFGKCPFLLRLKKVLSVSHLLHLRFSRNKSVTCTVVSVNRPFIMRYISGKREFLPLHFRYSCGNCVASMPHIPIARASSGRGDKFCHQITKFYIFLSVCPQLHIRSRCDQAFSLQLNSVLETCTFDVIYCCKETIN